MIEKELNGDSEYLYYSNKDIQPDEPEIKQFNPDPDINFTINEPLKPVQGVFQNSVQTIIPNSVNIVPDLNAVSGSEAKLIIDETKLSKVYDYDKASQIISDIKNDVPLTETDAKILIKNDIVREANKAETVATKEQINLPSNPVNNNGSSKVIIKKGSFKNSGLINNITEFIYKLIYV